MEMDGKHRLDIIYLNFITKEKFGTNTTQNYSDLQCDEVEATHTKCLEREVGRTEQLQ